MTSKAMVWKIFLLATLLSSFAFAQQAPLNSPLLDHLAGRWVLKGTIAGQQVIHDVDGEWTLDHHYLRIHEVSRDKNGQGKPNYEAIVFVVWNEQPKQYACAWLDVFGGLPTESIGVATPKENEIPFVFKDDKGSISLTNDFLYHLANDTWEWQIDNIDKGVAKPFTRVQLTRAER
jgi:hypothetical protein